MPHAQPTLGTIADYFRFGIEAGLLTPEHARAWADSAIMKLDCLPGEVIEVSISSSNPALIEALSSISGQRDSKLAGSWLLGLLRQMLNESDENLSWLTQHAMQVVRATDLGEDIYYVFDTIDDQLSLAQSNTYGTMAECRKDLENALSSYANVPFRVET
jgi:hypothetical protein